MADVDLDALDALLAAATPAPWRACRRGDAVVHAYGEEPGDPHMTYTVADLTQNINEGDAHLIAAARNALPHLISEARFAERLRAEIARLRVEVAAAANAHRNIGALLIANGCDCECDNGDPHGPDCDRCLACRIDAALATARKEAARG